jgi:acetoin utilization deacetylase AcuC-like enzyme
VQDLAPSPGRLVLFLEGGYDLDALERSTSSTLAALAGDAPAPEPPTSGGPGREAVTRTARAHADLH